MRWVAFIASLSLLLATCAAAGVRTVALSYQVHDPRWSPNGKLLAYVVTHAQVDSSGGFANPRGRARIWVVNADGSNAHPVTPIQFAVQNIAWSPSGHSIAYAAGRHIWRYDLGGNVTQITNGRYDVAWWPTWSPDGKTLAFTEGYYSFAGTPLIGSIPSQGGIGRTLIKGYQRPVWSPDGSAILTDSGAFIDPKADLHQTPRPAPCAARAWSIDGRYLFANLTVCDAVTGARVDGWPVRGLRPIDASLSADDRVFAATGGENGHVFVISRVGISRALPDSDSANEAAAWSPLGPLAYIARGSCGRHSEIRIADEHAGHVRTLVRAC